MSDWQIGDLALCVSNGPNPIHWQSGSGGPVKGGVYQVADIDIDSDGTWLNFPEFPDDGFLSLGFRKIKPHTPDREDVETIRLLNTAKSPEPA